MVKKIKVVELNQPSTEVETPPLAPDPDPVPTVEEPTATEAIAPVGEKQPKKPRQPRQPKEPKAESPVQKVEDPESDGDSINTEEIMTVISEHRKKKLAPVVPVEEPVPPASKEEAKATCPDCKKVMSAKALKYSHAKNCKAKPPPPPPPPEPKKRAVKPRAPKVAVETPQEQYLRQEVAPTIHELIQAERAMRQGARKQKFQSLLSEAFHNNI